MTRWWPFVRCHFCHRRVHRSRLFVGACADCVRDTVEWIKRVPGWVLCVDR